jgi:dTDP-4-dehydrorhamnose 3,5-epimerase-like enzyme
LIDGRTQTHERDKRPPTNGVRTAIRHRIAVIDPNMITLPRGVAHGFVRLRRTIEMFATMGRAKEMGLVIAANAKSEKSGFGRTAPPT